MKLSKKCEYACLALIDLSCHYGDVIPASLLAGRNKIPRKFLDQIMMSLKEKGYVESIRGSNGGYRLGKKPQEISLAEIIRLIDGPIAPIASVSEFFYQHTPSEQNKKLLGCFKEIRDFTVGRLEVLTFDQLC